MTFLAALPPDFMGNFNLWNAFFTTIVAALVSLVAIAKGKDIAREKYEQALENYVLINRSQEEKIALLTKESDQARRERREMAREQQEMQERMNRLLLQHYEDEQYCEVLKALMRDRQIPIPPRSQNGEGEEQ